MTSLTTDTTDSASFSVSASPTAGQAASSSLSQGKPINTRLGLAGNSASSAPASTSVVDAPPGSISATPTIDHSATVYSSQVSPAVKPSATAFSDERQLEEASGHDSHKALIIGCVILGLILLLILLFILWFFVIRRRKKARARRREPTNPWDKERGGGGESDGTSGTSLGSLGTSEGEGGSWRSFNPLNMVVPRSIFNSLTHSRNVSQVTGNSHPPPPYGNGLAYQYPITVEAEDEQDFHSRSSIQTRPSNPEPPEESNIGETMIQTAQRGHITHGSLAELLPSTLTVHYTFTPKHGDELTVQRGDKLHIAGIFDDGWCLCKSEEGKRGVVPLACFNMAELVSGDGAGPGVQNGTTDSQQDGMDTREDGDVAGAGGDSGGDSESIVEEHGSSVKEKENTSVKRSPRISSHHVSLAIGVPIQTSSEVHIPEPSIPQQNTIPFPRVVGPRSKS